MKRKNLRDGRQLLLQRQISKFSLFLFSLFVNLRMAKSNRFLLYSLPPSIQGEIEQLCSEKESAETTTLARSLSNSLMNSKENGLIHFACSLCSLEFSSLEEQKEHYRSEEHLEQVKERCLCTKDEEDSESDEDENVEILEDGYLLSLQLSSSQITLYKRLLECGIANREVQLEQLASHLSGHFCIILYRSGYFVFGIFQRGQLVHYFQDKRYTTRRKQGGAQSKKDNASGKAISMGARLRRHNEQLLREFVRKTLREQQEAIAECSLVFVGASKLNL